MRLFPHIAVLSRTTPDDRNAAGLAPAVFAYAVPAIFLAKSRNGVRGSAMFPEKNFGRVDSSGAVMACAILAESAKSSQTAMAAAEGMENSCCAWSMAARKSRSRSGSGRDSGFLVKGFMSFSMCRVRRVAAFDAP
jgi:hypothetical protein